MKMMRKWPEIVLLGALALAPGTAAAAPARAALYGIEIGSPLAIPPCPMTQFGTVQPVQHPMCWAKKSLSSDASPESGTLAVYFDPDSKPPYSKFDSFDVTTAAGMVESIQVFTDGAASQNGLYSSLLAKFGKPKAVQRQRESNMAGARFSVVSADWHTKSGDEIHLLGALDTFSTGVILALSPAAAAKQAADLKARSGPSL